MGDLSAVLFSLRNNGFRGWLAEKTNGKMADAEELASLARAIWRKERRNALPAGTALNKKKMADVKAERDPHKIAEVLLGAMFDILKEIVSHFDSKHNKPLDGSTGDEEAESAATPKELFAWAMPLMQVLAVQPLDFLPPIDVTFRDYAIAVCHAQRFSNPTDTEKFQDMLIKVFRARGVLSEQDEAELRKPRNLYERMQLSVYLDIDEISRSRAAAYRFLDDNREDLCIPAFQDFIVVDLYDCNKQTEQARADAPPDRDRIPLGRRRAARRAHSLASMNGQSTTMLCGGTLVVDDNGNVLEWARKPGSLPYGKPQYRQKNGMAGRHRRGKRASRRVSSGLSPLNRRCRDRRRHESTEHGLLGTRIPPIVAVEKNGSIRFRRSPHFRVCGEHHEDTHQGGRQWEISC